MRYRCYYDIHSDPHHDGAPQVQRISVANEAIYRGLEVLGYLSGTTVKRLFLYLSMYTVACERSWLKVRVCVKIERRGHWCLASVAESRHGVRTRVREQDIKYCSCKPFDTALASDVGPATLVELVGCFAFRLVRAIH